MYIHIFIIISKSKDGIKSCATLEFRTQLKFLNGTITSREIMEM